MIEATAFMMKDESGYKMLYPNRHSGTHQIAVISEMNEKDFLFMLEVLQNENFRDYIFPRSSRIVELRAMLRRIDEGLFILDINLDINLGAITISKMTKDEFKELVKELIELQDQEIGSKVHFPLTNNKA